MGKMQRRKGANGEREIVNILRAFYIPAKKISMLETNSIDKGDIQIGDSEKGSVKRGQHVPKFIYEALGDCQYLFTRRDHQKWLVVVPIDIFVKMLKNKYNSLVIPEKK